MSIPKEFVVNPLTALLPDTGHFSKIAQSIDSIGERFETLSEEILPEINALPENDRRIILAEYEMLKQVRSWIGAS